VKLKRLPLPGARRSLAYVGIFGLVYVLGATSYALDLWPIPSLRTLKNATIAKTALFRHDSFGRLKAFPDKKEIWCPAQTPDTGLILAIGQSNAANHAEQRYTTKFPTKVYNHWEGKCYVAESPLLGASGEEGEFITQLADKLISNGTYKAVIIVTAAIGSTPVAEWQQGGRLNTMLLSTLHGLNAGFHVTEVVWHQGEADMQYGTSTAAYVASLTSLLASLKAAHVDAPAYVAIATKCPAGDWNPVNPISVAQRSVIDSGLARLGADTDALLSESDRRPDGCHLSASGQDRVSSAYAEAIASNHPPK
jgi:hypothetical protein